MYEWAAKVDEYARGMIGPPGSTLFEELGLYYIGPVDGHNIEDLVCVLNEVASLDSMGPVLVHVITKEEMEVGDNQMNAVANKIMEGVILISYPFPFFHTKGPLVGCIKKCLIVNSNPNISNDGISYKNTLLKYNGKDVEKVSRGNCVFNHAHAFKTLALLTPWLVMY